MGMIDWLLGRRNKDVSPQQPVLAAPPKSPDEPSEQEAFKSPILLANWVNKWWLEQIPLNDNYSLLPDEEQRAHFNITYEQRERYVREISILRMAGISLFIKQNYDDAFWLKYSSAIYPMLTAHLFMSEVTPAKIGDVAEAVEAYVAASTAKDEEQMASIYMRRVYDDSDHFIQLKLGGVGFLSVNWLMDAYEIFRDAYCKITQGMSYESLKHLTEVIDKIEEKGAAGDQ